MVQWDQQHLGNTVSWLQFLAWHSCLRICCCCSFSLGGKCGSDLIPGPGTPYATGQPKKKAKKKKRNIEFLELDMLKVGIMTLVESVS